MQIDQIGSYRLDSAALTCALKHVDDNLVENCDVCRGQAEKIQAALCLWREWPQVRQAIQASNLAGRVTTLDLNYAAGTLITPENCKKLSTPVTPEPIVFGYSKEANSPFLVIRYLDVIHNEKAGISPWAKSFITVVLGTVPYVGLEQVMTEAQFIKAEVGYRIEGRTTFNLDGGVGVTDYVVRLLKGELNGKTVI